MKVRTYGTAGPFVVVVHGGPGAAGYMAPVARGLADSFRVLEPFQRGSGGPPLTVARHVEDLRELVEARCPGAPPALVGSSWGAMLALAFAAEHPALAGPLALVGCGTFDAASRQRFELTVEERMGDGLARRLERLSREISDPDELLRRKGELILPLYSFELLTTDQELEEVDARANRESWSDMLRRQARGDYPAAFAAIRSPVLMLHGTFDPHPGRMVQASLAPHLERLEHRALERCGHYPWLERSAREPFFALLRDWLARHT